MPTAAVRSVHEPAATAGVVLDQLRALPSDARGMDRAELACRTALSAVTVGRALSDLCAQGAVSAHPTGTLTYFTAA